MFSPLNDPQVEEWFRRFDAASRRLPAEERASQREEIHQHLVGLVAAKVAQGQSHDEAWQAALTQFGDATQIGRKMYQEWQQSRTGFRADMKAILFGIGLYVLDRFVLQILANLWLVRFYSPNDSLYTHGRGVVGAAHVTVMAIGYGGAILINIAIGRKYPLQALKGALYANLFCILWSYGFIIVVTFFQRANHIPQWSVASAHPTLLTPFWIAGHVTVAYLASVTKRGWYRPSVADFKLTSPRRRLRLSR